MKVKTKAMCYFYPDGFWGGYAKFFEPHIPDRIGSELISIIRSFLEHGNKEDLGAAKYILSNRHLKNVHDGRDVTPIMCYPTNEAMEAIRMLNSHESDMREQAKERLMERYYKCDSDTLEEITKWNRTKKTI